MNLWSMEIHEIKSIEDFSNTQTTVIRVPGGWIYRSWSVTHEALSTVFVPLNFEGFTATSGEGEG